MRRIGRVMRRDETETINSALLMNARGRRGIGSTKNKWSDVIFKRYSEDY